MINRRALLAGAATSALVPAMASGTVRKPRLPPGRDPGGVAVAVIGGGVDYTDPVIAPRLARDGEGDLIGWDFVDNDNRPFALADSGTATLRSLIDRAPSARFIPIRVPRDDGPSHTRALGFVLQTPARIVFLAETSLQTGDVERVRAVAAGPRSVLLIGAANVATASAVDNLLVLSSPAACLTAIEIAVRLIDAERIESGEVLRQRLQSSPELSGWMGTPSKR